jgi:hypothetical protein
MLTSLLYVVSMSLCVVSSATSADFRQPQSPFLVNVHRQPSMLGAVGAPLVNTYDAMITAMIFNTMDSKPLVCWQTYYDIQF